MAKTNSGILGTGHSYPAGILTNADLERIVDTSDEWITSRTGIKQRRKAAPEEYTSQFAVRAAREAIARAGVEATDIDLILCATVTPDQILPSTGCLIQAQLGAKGCFSAETIARGDHFFKMRGNELFKVAVRSMTDISREVLDEAGLTTEDVKIFIPHQANQRITDAVANKLSVDDARVYSNIA